jgi:mannose/fructose-specific phosphotransferase system component IIA
MPFRENIRLGTYYRKGEEVSYMRRILVLTHGELASGFLSALEVINGEGGDVQVAGVNPNDAKEDIRAKISTFLEQHAEGDDAVILTDVPGGSSTSIAVDFVSSQRRVFLVSGLNLSMLLEIAFAGEEEDTVGLLRLAVESGRESIFFLNDKFSV